MEPSQAALRREVERRRTFAIISHPDAGKTTLTEKLLLFGGAVREAGAVRAQKAARHATSDWLELEKQRGISVSSSVLHFEHEGFRVNILDTPGHQDFSEDTYRTLMAADSAVMLIDAAKGVEPQTRKLFQVCRLRGIPIFTFVNKMDRRGRDPLELMDDIESVLGIDTVPVNWPIGSGSDFQAACTSDAEQRALLFSGGDHGTTRGRPAEEIPQGAAGFRSALREAVGAPSQTSWRVAGAARRRRREARAGARAGRRADADVLRQRAHQLRRAALPRLLPARGAGADGTVRASDRGSIDPVETGLLGLRVQDPGEHGPGPSRPHRVPARLLGPLREGHASARHVRSGQERCAWRSRRCS